MRCQELAYAAGGDYAQEEHDLASVGGGSLRSNGRCDSVGGCRRANDNADWPPFE